MLLIRRFDRLFKDLVRLGKHLVHGTTLLAEQLAHDIAALLGEHGTADAVDPVVDRDGRRLLLIVDLDLRLELLQNAAVGTDHKTDRLADIEDIAVCKAAPVLRDHPQLVLSVCGNVPGRDKMVALRKFGQMDRLDPAAGNGGADHVGILHIGQGHIADVHRLASCLLQRVHTDDPIIDLRRRFQLVGTHFRHINLLQRSCTKDRFFRKYLNHFGFDKQNLY